MARLHRPYIPIPVRVVVAQRMVLAANPSPAPTLEALPGESATRHLHRLLISLYGDRPVHLDHDPALENRERYVRKGKTLYRPPANHPNWLVYREGGKPGGGSEHDIKTRVRGEHGQLSDHAIARKEKRRVKKAKQAAQPNPEKTRFRQPRRSDKVTFVGRGGKVEKTTYGDFVDRFNRGDPSTIDRRATALANRPPHSKIQSRGFPPKGSRKFRSAR